MARGSTIALWLDDSKLYNIPIFNTNLHIDGFHFHERAGPTAALAYDLEWLEIGS